MEKEISERKLISKYLEKTAAFFAPVAKFFKPVGVFLKKYVFDKIVWAADRIVDFVKSQNKTKPLRRKLVIWTLSIILGLMVVIVIIFGIGIYKFDWDDKFTNKVIKVIPYPAAVSSSSWITMNQFKKEFGYLEHYYKESNFPALTDKKTARDEVLEQLINRQILKIEAPKYGIKVSKEELESEYKKLLSTTSSESEFLSIIKKLYGMNKNDFKELLADQILITRSMDELPLRIKVQHILLVNDFSDKAKEEESLKLAQDILNQAKKDPKKFTDLAKKYSQDEKTKNKGGDLDWISRGDVNICGKTSTKFEDAVMKLNVNDISGPIKTECGFEIVKINGKEGWIDQSYNSWLKEKRKQTKIWKFID